MKNQLIILLISFFFNLQKIKEKTKREMSHTEILVKS